MMNELLELELWKIIGQGNDESGGGYSSGGRGSLVHKSCTKRILYLRKVPSQSSHIGPDRDDSSPMSLRLMANGEGNEVSKVKDVPVRHAPQEVGVVSQGWGEGRRLRAARIIGGKNRDKTTKAELDRSRIVEVCHNDLKMEGQAEFHRELEPSQCSGPHLGVRPVISEIVPPEVPRRTKERVMDLNGRT
ncbi:hypothetical protein GOBAR_AA19688 [Gossypium barbadense]|uniref:Uncharacterized protein n=1 Tax=Gossypium barbadense TaxID=3634 RepID=A0A2P5XCA2_GOSBA|nr:hypothetical protein GOBAR_AA19688 [Gossypium barbadense]